MPVADVLLFCAAPLRFAFAAREAEPPLTKVLEVAPGLQLAGIKPDIASAVLHACKFRQLEPGGESVIYAFVRYDPPGNHWDEDQAISKALFLSHFVHAHEGGFEFTATIETDERGRLVRLEPADVAPPFVRAYCCAGVQRRWLTQADAGELKELIASYDAARPGLADTRVGLAISTFFESPFVFHGRPRALLLATTLEGLVSTSPDRAFKQFTTRVPAIASEVSLSRLDGDWAERIYKLRSKLAHGGPLLRSVDEHRRQIKLDELNTALTDMDELLRRVLKRALIDAEFRIRVENPDAHWPVLGRGCPTCRKSTPQLLVVQCPQCGGSWK